MIFIAIRCVSDLRFSYFMNINMLRLFAVTKVLNIMTACVTQSTGKQIKANQDFP